MKEFIIHSMPSFSKWQTKSNLINVIYLFEKKKEKIWVFFEKFFFPFFFFFEKVRIKLKKENNEDGNDMTYAAKVNKKSFSENKQSLFYLKEHIW